MSKIVDGIFGHNLLEGSLGTVCWRHLWVHIVGGIFGYSVLEVSLGTHYWRFPLAHFAVGIFGTSLLEFLGTVCWSHLWARFVGAIFGYRNGFVIYLYIVINKSSYTFIHVYCLRRFGIKNDFVNICIQIRTIIVTQRVFLDARNYLEMT